MILKPDDVLQKGDVITWQDGTSIVVSDWLIGKPLKNITTGLARAERPSLSDADKVRVLREALEHVAGRANHNIPHYAYGDNEAGCDLAMRLDHILDDARAALSATE
jgi:hypothetical protein